jgi:RNA polymerase sigma-70 factor (ECF subfamily)
VRQLARALDRLPRRLKAVLVLRTIEEREYDEVAAILGVRPATARTQLSQARRLLLRWLAPWLGDAGASAEPPRDGGTKEEQP